MRVFGSGDEAANSERGSRWAVALQAHVHAQTRAQTPTEVKPAHAQA